MIKKITIVLFVFSGMFLFVACKKDWSCECSLNGVTQKDRTLVIKDAGKTKALNTCDNHEETVQLENEDLHCKLK